MASGTRTGIARAEREGANRPSAAHQRARGELRLSFKLRDGATVLDQLRQEGCLKARFPRVEAPEWPGAVTLNSAGGVAGGDALSTWIVAGAGTAATVASQAAERVYRAVPGMVASVSTRLEVEAGAALEWLPQETILFDGCAVRRRLAVELAGNAAFLGVESLVFGRAAMGEEVRQAFVHDRVTVRRGGRLVLHDAIRFDGPVASVLDRGAVGRGAGVGRGARAVGTLVHVAGDAEAWVAPLRAGLAGFEAGVSAWDGLLLARIVAPTGAVLRQAVVTGLNILRGGRTLPRVWLC